MRRTRGRSAPAIKRAQAAGVVVVAVDVAAAGADATVQTNNVQAGEIACQYLADKINGKGNVIIENGPQVSSVIERVKGCKEVLAKHPDIKILSDDQDGKGSREGGMNAMQGYLTRFPDIAGVFTINDPQAIGSDLAAKQLNRTGIVITSVDGAPDIVPALKGTTLVQASASQDPTEIGTQAVRDRLRHHERQEARKPDGPDAVHARRPGQRGSTRAGKAVVVLRRSGGGDHAHSLQFTKGRGVMADVICLGELLIDFVPTVTGCDLASADTFKKAAGGAPANVAVGLARFGVSSGFMGKIGADGFGRFLTQTLASAGVDTAMLVPTEAAPTALAFVSLRADGEREFLFYRSPSADMLFSPEDVDAAALGRSKILHFGSISLIGGAIARRHAACGRRRAPAGPARQL